MLHLHCNNCFRQRNLEPTALNFHFIPTCQHILCDNCLSNTETGKGDTVVAGAETCDGDGDGDGVNDSSCAAICPLCKREYREAVTINKDLPAKYRSLFENPLNQLRRYQQISKFQNEQRGMLYGHNLAEDSVKRSELQQISYDKILKKLCTSIEEEHKRCDKLRVYIDWHERHGHNASGTQNPPRPKTPMLYSTSLHPDDSGIDSRSTDNFSIIQ